MSQVQKCPNFTAAQLDVVCWGEEVQFPASSTSQYAVRPGYFTTGGNFPQYPPGGNLIVSHRSSVKRNSLPVLGIEARTLYPQSTP